MFVCQGIHSVTLYFVRYHVKLNPRVLPFMGKSLSFNQMKLKAQNDPRNIQTNKHKGVKHDIKSPNETYYQIEFMQSFALYQRHNKLAMCES